MVLKIMKAVWFLSVVVSLANLLYVYASLPEIVAVHDKGGSFVSLSRDVFFYLGMIVVGVINTFVYVVSAVYKSDIDLRTWFHGLVVTINIFFIVALNFIALFNSGDGSNFKYGDINFVIYGSVILFVLWALAWPVYAIYRKISTKQSVQNT